MPPELTEAGQGLMQGLTGEIPAAKPATTTDYVQPIADEGPRGKPQETVTQPDPVDPETGEVLDLKSDESPLDLKTLYKAKVHVDHDGESIAVTVGELKDMYSDLIAVKTKASETETARDEFGREQLLARQEFDAMVAMLPPEARSPEFLAATQQRIQQHNRAETVKLLKIVPEWSDPQQVADDQRLINKHASRYGFSAAEISLISDHRMLKYLRDNARAEMRLANVELKQAEPKAMAPTQKRGRRTGSDTIADIKTAAAEGKVSKRVAAGQVLVEALKRG